jgi:hypothetical protein
MDGRGGRVPQQPLARTDEQVRQPNPGRKAERVVGFGPGLQRPSPADYIVENVDEHGGQDAHAIGGQVPR